jgi:small neutral amino acid transporter SnatA (MarC family)
MTCMRREKDGIGIKIIEILICLIFLFVGFMILQLGITITSLLKYYVGLVIVLFGLKLSDDLVIGPIIRKM